MDNKFKSNPYNSLNTLISENDILNILNDHNIQGYKKSHTQVDHQ